jgi:mRNA-degrading endonuclease RelE of RelBE toxin-antitoxin system
MTRTILWSQSAVEHLVEIAIRDLKLARRIMITIRGFGTAERVDLKKLAGVDGAWRIRVGDWRVLLTMNGDQAVIERVENRRDVY